ncbi:alpha/beta hydrolase fold domain-containing protein [Streptomyces sp. NRRL WC-3742]|uniref:alpha/beta hydrolase fold domain-containing protein n=1 Tax=Streptomyces sp. NRRL WC-3742 TaxID=1463934 RepID=UPI00099B9243|nr:alpha/beta hydrolase fold domain-containing protein [Streptomyces sp. NRRL WC-3742]
MTTADADEDRPRGKLLRLPQAPDAIELRHLRAFVAVAAELHFGRAAARLYVSQPALSRQIRSLERLVGCDLLRRSTHQVELTPAGAVLLDRARRIIDEVDEAVSATRSLGGELAARMARYWEPVGDATDRELLALRTAYEALHAQFAPPPEVTVRPVNADGVPSLLLTPPNEASATVLFLHGGAYISGSAFGYRPLVGALATECRAGVLLPDYRLAPEHPYPAAVEDALSAYLWLVDNGTAPGEITVAGDSAGAHLTLSALLTLKHRQLPMPGRVVLLCPGVDLACRSLDDEPHEPHEPRPAAMTAEALRRRFITDYLAGHSTDDPLVRPLTADLGGLPPMLVQAGTGDALLADARQLVDRARESGVDVRLELYPVATHNFHLFWSFLPEAADALRHAGRFVRKAAHGLSTPAAAGTTPGSWNGTDAPPAGDARPGHTTGASG